MKLKDQYKSILIVSSSPQERDPLALRFRSNDINVEIATGGFHALHLLEDPNNTFHLAIVLGDLEDTNALEAIGHMRSFLPAKELPILLVHEAQNQKEDQEAFNWGASELAPRTENFNSLLKRVKKLLST